MVTRAISGSGGKKVYTEVKTLTASGGTLTITCGFEPTKIFAYKLAVNNNTWATGSEVVIYDKAMNSTRQFRAYTSGTATLDNLDLTTANVSRFYNITSTSFDFGIPTSSSYAGTWYFVAVE